MLGSSREEGVLRFYRGKLPESEQWAETFGGSPRRAPGARAGKLELWAGAPDDGGHASGYWEWRGGLVPPESSGKGRQAVCLAGSNSCSLAAEGEWHLGETGEMD